MNATLDSVAHVSIINIMLRPLKPNEARKPYAVAVQRNIDSWGIQLSAKASVMLQKLSTS